MSKQTFDQAMVAGLGPVICVVGARPNFMKMAPILRAMAAHVPPLPVLLVHTGQHYDKDMSDRLFEDLHLPRPDVNLEVGSGTHAVQTAEVMRRFEPIVDSHKPSCVAVVGDVNSTLACSLVAVKKGVPVVHIEAGLRSYDTPCRKKLIACSRTRFRTGSTRQSVPPKPTWRGRAFRQTGFVLRVTS